ncbi:hypothetical protein ILYODFUR_032126, partial [Ilyodon furcidens]
RVCRFASVLSHTDSAVKPAAQPLEQHFPHEFIWRFSRGFITIAALDFSLHILFYTSPKHS